jgi:hypothetical protein
LFRALVFSSFGIVQSKTDGIWNRTILAGARPFDILITQVIVCIVIQSVSLFETFIVFQLFIDFPMNGSIGLLLVFTIVTLLVGASVGIAISVLIEDFKTSTLITFGYMQIASNLSGCFW